MKVFYITVSLLLQCKQLFSSSYSTATLLNRNGDKKKSYLQYPDTTGTYYTAYQSTFARPNCSWDETGVAKMGGNVSKACWGKQKVTAAAVAWRGEERGEKDKCTGREEMPQDPE